MSLQLPRRCDVLVVGGGPAGAATATLAARAGLDVVLIEREHFPRHKPCAEYLSPEAARDLDALGVLDDVEAANPARLRGFRLVADDGTAAVGRYADAPTFIPYRDYGLALPRAVLDGIVLSAAERAGAVAYHGVTLDALVKDGGRVIGARVRAGGGVAELRAKVVVGADGLNSRVARELGVARRGGLKRLSLVAHLEGVTGTGDLGEMFAGRGRYLGLAPVGGGIVNVAAVVPATDAPRIAANAGAHLAAQLRAVPELARRVASARLTRRVLISGPFARRSRRVVFDGALLVGDAADFYDPFTGEGIFAALRGGRLAAEAIIAALAGGAADRRALRPYLAGRRRAFLGKWVLERLVAHASTRPALMRRFTRRLAARRGVADLWVGAAGDSVPVRALFAPRHLAALIG